MDLVLRAITIYLVVFALTRVLGRREMSSLQPFDLILLVVIGDLVQNGISQSDLSVTGVMIVLITIGLMQVFTSFLGFRSRRLRHLLQGEPIVLVHQGTVITKNLRQERLDDEDLAQQARVNGIGSIDEVKWAVLETNGEISFIT
jgi:uncharacterized membrane protein YcaP (DUF421 family)